MSEKHISEEGTTIEVFKNIREVYFTKIDGDGNEYMMYLSFNEIDKIYRKLFHGTGT